MIVADLSQKCTDKIAAPSGESERQWGYEDERFEFSRNV
jgi:hypothetical protein